MLTPGAADAGTVAVIYAPRTVTKFDVSSRSTALANFAKGTDLRTWIEVCDAVAVVAVVVVHHTPQNNLLPLAGVRELGGTSPLATTYQHFRFVLCGSFARVCLTHLQTARHSLL